MKILHHLQQRKTPISTNNNIVMIFGWVTSEPMDRHLCLNHQTITRDKFPKLLHNLKI